MGYAGEKIGNEIVGLGELANKPNKRQTDGAVSSNKQTQLDELLVRAAKWGMHFYTNVHAAGGDPFAVFNTFSEESIVAMVRNGLDVRYKVPYDPT